MSTRNIPFSIYKRKSAKIIPNLQLLDFFFMGLKVEFETAMVNEPSVFKPLRFYCTRFFCLLLRCCLAIPHSYGHVGMVC